MDPTGAWQQIINQGPLFAFMCLVLFFGAKYLTKRQETSDARYNDLVDKMLTTQQEQIKAVTGALTANTAVMERVERKLG
jgi:hypothetical protein